MTLAEIAARIDAHLKRMEKDPKINTPRYLAEPFAYKDGKDVAVSYSVAFYTLKKPDALAYLAWLDAGNVGKHWEMERRTK